MVARIERPIGRYVIGGPLTGLYRPRIVVYGHKSCNAKGAKIHAYGAPSVITPFVKGGYYPDKSGGVRFDLDDGISISGIPFKLDVTDSEEWERTILDECRKTNSDAYHVNEERDLLTATKNHGDRYAEQLMRRGFKDFLDRTKRSFEEFANEHPEYFNP